MKLRELSANSGARPRPPDLYYNDATSRAYTTSSRIQHIQSQMTHRALELLDLREPSFVLDVGCGSGLSGEILSDPSRRYRGRRRGGDSASDASDDEEEEDDDDGAEDDGDMDLEGNTNGTLNDTTTSPQPQRLSHTWVGLDISASMLGIARFTRSVEGDLFLSDMGQGLAFRPGTFDAAISISALQWLCTAESNDEASQPERRLKRFFESLYVALRRGGRAVLQFYPKNKEQTGMIGRAASAAGFGAGMLVDDEGTKNEKMYLVCVVGGGDVSGIVRGMEGVDVDDARRAGGRGAERDGRGRKRKEVKGGKGWIMRKKDQMEKRGKVVKADSKYTGRKRRPKF